MRFHFNVLVSMLQGSRRCAFPGVLVLAQMFLVVCNVSAQSSAPVVPVTTITQLPVTISAPGTYLLKKSLNFDASSGVAITINADDVVLDLGGRIITNTALQDASNTAVGIQSSSSAAGIIVRNGILRNFRRGVVLDNSGQLGRVLVERITVDNAGTQGIFARGEAVEVKRCRILSPGYVSTGITEIVGIQATSPSILVSNNVVHNIRAQTGVTTTAIFVTTTNSAKVERNMVSAATKATTGIGCSQTTPAASFVSENAIQNFTTGISFVSTGGGKYRANLTKNCTTAFSGGTAIGSENN